MNESKGIWASNQPDRVSVEQKDFESAHYSTVQEAERSLIGSIASH